MDLRDELRNAEKGVEFIPIYTTGVVARGYDSDETVYYDVLATIDEAIKEADKLEGMFVYDREDDDHYVFVKADLIKCEYNDNGDVIYPNHWQEVDPVQDDHTCNIDGFEWGDLVYEKSFGQIEDAAIELRRKIETEIANDISGERFTINGCSFTVNWLPSENVGYSFIQVLESESGYEIGLIEVRISDHSYNPKRVNDPNSFFSITVAENDATESKFMLGSNNLRFIGDDKYEYVVGCVKGKIISIIKNW